MSRLPLDYLRHIADELDFLSGIYARCDEKEFSEDGTLQRAVARSLEVIGEATKRLGRDFCTKYPETPWTEMARMRDKLIHHYFGIDQQLVWNVIEVEIPSLYTKIQEIIKYESKLADGTAKEGQI